MSSLSPGTANHRKGYQAERAIEVLLQKRVPSAYRPRAGNHQDVGDIAGLPLVVSVKNQARLALALWCSELEAMVEHAGMQTGVVWHKTKGHTDPHHWYVTTNGALFLPLFDAYMKVTS